MSESGIRAFLDRARNVYTLPWADPQSAATYEQTMGVASTGAASSPADVINSDRLSQSQELQAPQINWNGPSDKLTGAVSTALPKSSANTYRVPNIKVKTPSVDPTTITPAKGTVSSFDGYGKRHTSGYGRSAYGYSGLTGQASSKGSGPKGIQQPFWNQLSRAFSDMKNAGLGVPGITDGFRSYAQQESVKRRKPNLAATPGRSIHGLGWAADLHLNSKQLKWLQANGSKYGLVQPMSYEPWHWQLKPSVARAAMSNARKQSAVKAKAVNKTRIPIS